MAGLVALVQRAGLIGLVALALAALAPGAQAQQVSESVSPAARCLVVEAGKPEEPEYPNDKLKSGQGGSTQVLLVFTAPDAAPSVQVLEHTDEPYAEAVRQHARHLRVPCMSRSEAPVRLLRDYRFRPDDRKVHWFSARDATAAEDAKLLNCRTHVDGQERPVYPLRARELGIQGRVVAELRFDAADRPPTVKLHARSNARSLTQGVGHWLHGLRLPCHPGRPVHTDFTFIFTFEGEGDYGFRQPTFRQLLGTTAGITKMRLNFDTRAMGCPFDIRFSYRQPYLRNEVGQVGDPDPARRPLLEWLETIQFDVSAALLDAVYGDTVTVTVPCILIDLKPKE